MFFASRCKRYIERDRVKKIRKQQQPQHTFIFTMSQTQKVWMKKQAHAYAGKNAISKFLVKRKLPVPPPINKRGRGQPKTMRSQKKKKPLTICAYRDSGSGYPHEEIEHCHGLGCGRDSMEGTKRSLTDNSVDGRIKYRCDGSKSGDNPSTTMTELTPLTATSTNSIGSRTEYHRDGSQPRNSDNFYLDSGSDDGNGNTDSGGDDGTRNEYWYCFCLYLFLFLLIFTFNFFFTH